MGAGRRARETGLRLKSSKIFCAPLVRAGGTRQQAVQRCRGAEALETLYKEKPGEYLRLTASVLPREFIFENVSSDLDDEQIDELLLTLRQRMIDSRTAPTLLALPDADGVGEPEPRH
jgi:hypothetical protein